MAGKKQTGENLIGKGRPGPGRPKGVPNKNTTAIKDMILQALHEAGGVKYLEQQARSNPSAFLTLVGKVLPLQVTGEGGGAVQFERIERVFVQPDQPAQRPSIN